VWPLSSIEHGVVPRSPYTEPHDAAPAAACRLGNNDPSPTEDTAADNDLVTLSHRTQMFCTVWYLLDLALCDRVESTTDRTGTEWRVLVYYIVGNPVKRRTRWMYSHSFDIKYPGDANQIFAPRS
jgi:hypothetical protein